MGRDIDKHDFFLHGEVPLVVVSNRLTLYTCKKMMFFVQLDGTEWDGMGRSPLVIFVNKRVSETNRGGKKEHATMMDQNGGGRRKKFQGPGLTLENSSSLFGNLLPSAFSMVGRFR